MSKGKFTHIYHPHNEKLFENASIDVLIFRYQFFESENKNLDSKIIYNDENMYINNSNGLITFGKTEKTTNFKVEDYFNVYVGLVTGLEEVYKNDTYGNIEVLNAEDKLEKYIFLETFPSKNPEINKLLLENKSKLISRGIRKFNESNWFEWGAPRNIKTIREHMGKDCIYMTNLSRKEKVCFKEKVQYFGGNLLMMLPKQDLDLDKFVEYFNSEKFKSNFIFSGRFKIGQRQLCNYVF
jgi:adenine-specific DNA-methyltransferase